MLSFAGTTCFCETTAYAHSADTENSDTTQREIAANISENFNFIKSDEDSQSFIWDGSIFLYGGIALIVISVFGIIITFIPRKRRKKRRRKRLPQRKAQRYAKRH